MRRTWTTKITTHNFGEVPDQVSGFSRGVSQTLKASLAVCCKQECLVTCVGMILCVLLPEGWWNTRLSSVDEMGTPPWRVVKLNTWLSSVDPCIYFPMSTPPWRVVNPAFQCGSLLLFFRLCVAALVCKCPVFQSCLCVDLSPPPPISAVVLGASVPSSSPISKPLVPPVHAADWLEGSCHPNRLCYKIRNTDAIPYAHLIETETWPVCFRWKDWILLCRMVSMNNLICW